VPLYEFQCEECGTRFERLFRRVVDTPFVDCEECGKPAKKMLSACNHTFAHVPVGGPRPQNTGVHSIDYNADRVIGRDAARRWEMMEKRKAHKEGIVRDERKAGNDITLDHVVKDGRAEGGYRAIKKDEVGYVNDRREASFQVGQQASKQKKK